ncbi:MAG: nicotinate-nucleotide--dimethylbenzimidazole phosphoribosyltransferase [Oscillospiraceae bacterium]
MKLEQAILTIQPTCKDSMLEANKHWDLIAKPLNSLGLLENIITQLAGITRTQTICIDKRCLVIMCADNGIVSQGVTQADSIVTAIMAENFVKGTTTVCSMAKHIGVDVIPVDIGINRNISIDGLLSKKVMLGTNDFSKTTAMTREQVVQAIEVGINLALSLKEKGYQIIATGEMGIGNTTSSAAIASVLLGCPPEEVTGRGAGLDHDGIMRKIKVIKQAIAFHAPNKEDPIDVLSKVGGLDIAGLVGLFIGGAVAKLPVIIDGFISGISALLATKLAPLCKDYMIASHTSAEPAGILVLQKLEFLPLVQAYMCLGEGTGAMVALGILDMALAVFHNTITFPEIQLENYIHFT